MKKLNKLKLNVLSEASLLDKEMNGLRGGNCCSCSCYYENSGGASVASNRGANLGLGTTSTNGCSQYGACEGYDFDDNPTIYYGTCANCNESNPLGGGPK